jgi:hypothetical protein
MPPAASKSPTRKRVPFAGKYHCFQKLRSSSRDHLFTYSHEEPDAKEAAAFCIVVPYHHQCFIFNKYSNTPLPESFGDYVAEIAGHVSGLRHPPGHPGV